MRHHCVSHCPICARHEHSYVVDMALILVGGGLLLAAGLVWFTGQLACLLTSHVWLEMPVRALPGVVSRLPAHWRDPALAWPSSTRGRLPGPAGMYLTLVLAVIACLLSSMAARRLLIRR
jgi:hypothetical protein